MGWIQTSAERRPHLTAAPATPDGPMHTQSQPTPTSTPAHSSARDPREPIVFRKGDRRWVFVCDAGDEQALLEHIGGLAASRSGGFDWFDAALVGHQVRQRLNPTLRRETGPCVKHQTPTASGHGAA
jgi:hypothetical protein